LTCLIKTTQFFFAAPAKWNIFNSHSGAKVAWGDCITLPQAHLHPPRRDHFLFPAHYLPPWWFDGCYGHVYQPSYRLLAVLEGWISSGDNLLLLVWLPVILLPVPPEGQFVPVGLQSYWSHLRLKLVHSDHNIHQLSKDIRIFNLDYRRGCISPCPALHPGQVGR